MREIFTCILYWLISAIKISQTSQGIHVMTWNLCLHCNELPQQQRSARFAVERLDSAINKQSSSDWLNSCHVVFLVDYPDWPFLQHTSRQMWNPSRRLLCDFIPAIWSLFVFLLKCVCVCIWPRYSKDTVTLQAPIWPSCPARPVVDLSVGCLHHNLLPIE